MKKSFLINLFLLVAINLIVKLTYLFVIEVDVQNTLGPEQYGLFLALFNLSYLFQFINDPGIHSYNITNIAGSKERLSLDLPRITGLKLLLGGFFLIVVLVAGYVVGYRSIDLILILLIIGCNHALSTLFLYLRSNLSAIGRYKSDSIISALDKFILLFIIGFLLMYLRENFTLFHFIISQSIAFILAISIALIILGKHIKLSFPKVSIGYSKDLLKRSFPFALILLLMASYNKLDGVMLERLLNDGQYQAGIYAASLRFMDAANMMAYLFAALLLPMYAHKSTSSQDIEQLSDTGIRLMSVLILGICIIGIVFRNDLMSIYDVFDVQYQNILILHLLSFACIGISYIYGTLLTAKRRLKHFNWVLVIGVLVNVTLNLILIPEFKAEGAAYATFVTQFIVMAGQVFLAHRIFNLTVKPRLVFKIVLVGFICATAVIIINSRIDIHILLNISLSALFIMLACILSGIIRKDMIFALVNKESLSFNIKEKE